MTDGVDSGAPAKREQLVKLVEWNRREANCGTCGNKITWGVTLAGARMPLECAQRIAPLWTPAQRVRVAVRYAYATDKVHRIMVTDAAYEAKLVAKGRRIREEIVECWEIPASLTHFANCPRYRK